MILILSPLLCILVSISFACIHYFPDFVNFVDSCLNQIKLKGLHLNHNSIEDGGAQHVSAILHFNSTITEVSLNDNKLSDLSAGLFKEALVT